MKTDSEHIELLLPDGKKGSTMHKHQYELLLEFVFQKLLDQRKVTLTELLEGAEEILMDRIKWNLLWLLLQVKQDLVARGLIVVNYEKNRMQIISLKKSARKKLNMMGGFMNLKKLNTLSINVWHLKLLTI